MAQQYTVKPGDTLSKIAQQFNVGVDKISGYKSGNPNLIYPNEVLNIGDVGKTINASDIKPTTSIALPSNSSQASSGVSSLFSGSSVTSEVDKYRKQLEKTISNRKSEIDKQLEVAKAKEQATLGEIKTLTTPFRADLEAKQREELYINKNFEDNQKLIDELDSLLTEGNNLVTQQQNVTGLAAIRNPRVQKTMNDVAARAGVIEAVINARNGQIAVAENLIDRSVNAIAADRKDQLSYYETVLELNRQDILSLDSKSQKLADDQVNLIKTDLARAQETADYIKKLMVDPGTASLLGEAGVSLNDNIQSINSKLTKAQANRDIRDFSNKISLEGGVAVVDPTTVPQNQLVTYTDANGGKHYYKVPASSTSGGKNVSATEQMKLDVKEGQKLMVSDLRSATGADGYVSPADYRSYAQQWAAAGFDLEDFYSSTRVFVNPSHYSDYGIPEKYISS